MNRDQFKLLAAGKYAETQAQSTGVIDRKEMSLFIEGALFGWDMQAKINQSMHAKTYPLDGAAPASLHEFLSAKKTDEQKIK